MRKEISPQIEQIMTKIYDIKDLTEKSVTKKGIQVNQNSRIVITIIKDIMRIIEND